MAMTNIIIKTLPQDRQIEAWDKDDPEAQLIFDPERDRFLVMHVGWRNDYRIFPC